jgi:hypothetical protein
VIDTPGKNIPLRPPYELILVSTSNQRIGKRLANLRAQVRTCSRGRQGCSRRRVLSRLGQVRGHAAFHRALMCCTLLV